MSIFFTLRLSFFLPHSTPSCQSAFTFFFAGVSLSFCLCLKALLAVRGRRRRRRSEQRRRLEKLALEEGRLYTTGIREIGAAFVRSSPEWGQRKKVANEPPSPLYT